MENGRKKTIKTIMMGVLAAVCCTGLLFVASITPQEGVKTNATISAGYFGETPLFEEILTNKPAVRRDNYADCISFCIAWHLGNKATIEGTDRNNALVRMLEARYTQGEEENVNVGFERAMNEDAVGNVTYSRYWHGGAAVIRLLLSFLEVKSMRLLFLVIGMLLNVGFILYLVLHKEYALGIAYTLGILSGNLFFGYICFEYAFVCLFVPVLSFIVFRHMEKEKNNKPVLPLGGVFLVAGIITCFFDFLTAETLTFTIPAFVMLYCMTKKKAAVIRLSDAPKNAESRKLWRALIGNGLLWLVGYAGMFGFKWLLSFLVLGKEELATTAGYIAERSVGEVHLTQNMASPTVSWGTRIVEIFVRNFSCLFGLPEQLSTMTKALILLGIAAGIGLLWFFLRKEPKKGKEKGKKEASSFPVFLVLMCVPIVRFLVLSNHAYMHWFFTYRALIVIVMVLTLQLLRTTLLSRLTESR